jgi:transcriptional regulator with XRE-family HTH domain
MFRVEPRSTEDLSARYELIQKAHLPYYFISLPDEYIEKIRNALEEIPTPVAPAPGAVISVRVLDDTELQALPNGACAPFAVGSNNKRVREIRAAGRLYWACLQIALARVGETIMGDSAVIIIEPKVCASVRPYPDEDGTPVIRESLLECLNEEIERHQRKHLNDITIADAFSAGEGRVPNNPIVTAGLLALNKGGKHARELEGGFAENASGRPTFAYTPTQAKKILVYPVLDESGTGQIVNTQTLWRFIENLHAETPDIALAVLSQMCEPSVGDRPRYPMLTPVQITDEAILRYKGNGPETESSRLMVHAAMEHLRALSFDVCFNSPIPGRKLFWEGDRLFDIVKIEHYEHSLFGEKRLGSTKWLVRAGIWASVWFTPDTRQYIGTMARVLLQLGNRKNRLVAKRIGQRLLLSSQVCRSRHAQEVRVRELLGDIGELPLPKHREKNWASRIRALVEDALEVLRNNGVLKTVEWPDGIGPDDIDRSKGWVDRWLNARIRYTTLADRCRKSRPAGDSQTKGKRTDRRAEVPIGAEVRTARMNLVPHCTQEELAREMDISRRHLSQIETGKRAPPPDVAKRLQNWVEKRKEQERQSELGFGNAPGEYNSSCNLPERKDHLQENRRMHKGSTSGQTPMEASESERPHPDPHTESSSEIRQTTNVVKERKASRTATDSRKAGVRSRTGTDDGMPGRKAADVRRYLRTTRVSKITADEDDR